MSLMYGERLVKIEIYVFKCIPRNFQDEFGLVEGGDPIEALEKVVSMTRHFGSISEIDIFANTNGYLLGSSVGFQFVKFGHKFTLGPMLARYLDSEQAIKALAPDGFWKFDNGQLYVDGVLGHRCDELVELI